MKNPLKIIYIKLFHPNKRLMRKCLDSIQDSTFLLRKTLHKTKSYHEDNEKQNNTSIQWTPGSQISLSSKKMVFGQK